MKIEDIRDMRDDELQEALEKMERKLFDIRSQAVTETLANSKAVTNARRDIARVKTVLRERELAEQKG